MLDIANCTFINNSAVGDGGAIYASSSTPFYKRPSYATNYFNLKFEGNVAGGSGGAIF